MTSLKDPSEGYRHKDQHKTPIILISFFVSFWGGGRKYAVLKFSKIVLFGKCICVFVGVLCIIKLLFFNACIGSRVFFCRYEDMLKVFFQKCEQLSYEVFFSKKCIYTGIFGGNYYWYFRQ